MFPDEEILSYDLAVDDASSTLRVTATLYEKSSARGGAVSRRLRPPYFLRNLQIPVQDGLLPARREIHRRNGETKHYNENEWPALRGDCDALARHSSPPQAHMRTARTRRGPVGCAGQPCGAQSHDENCKRQKARRSHGRI
jgi:hypothetical protein